MIGAVHEFVLKYTIGFEAEKAWFYFTSFSLTKAY